MKRSSLNTHVSPRGIAALLTIVLGAPLGAQATAGAIAPQTGAVRIQIINPSQAQLDTLHVLMRQLEQLAPGTPAHETVLRQIDGLMPGVGNNRVVVRGAPAIRPGVVSERFPLPKGWIGLNVQGAHAEVVGTDGFFIEYFDRPSVTSVDPESPAQRAGIEPGDVLMAYNGSDVLGNRIDLTELLVPEKKISVTVKRDGDTKVYDMTVAKVPQGVMLRRRDLGTPSVGDVYFQRIMSGDDEMPRVPIAALPRAAVAGSMMLSNRGVLVTPNGALGAVMSTVSPELAKMLKLETGVLVNDISDGTPASKAGLHPGDVIVNVAGQPVSSLRSLQEKLLRHTEPSVVLQVVRDRKTRKITVSW